MDKLLESFYKTLKSFLRDLIGVFPEDDSLKVISTSLTLAMKENDKEIIHSFYETISPFHQFIGNHLFFDKIVFKNKYHNELFEKLEHYYNVLNESNKKIIWDYIEILFNLSKKITE
jgi:hypothetical protein